MSAHTTVHVEVNGRPTAVEVEPRRLLSDVIRHDLGLTGTHVGCEQGVCGSCTILLDGLPVRSCLVFAVQVEGRSVTTIEGVTATADGALHPVQQAFHEHHALQCGFCTPGLVLSLVALADERRAVDDAELADQLSGHLCRCTGYRNIVAAARAALGGGAE